MLCSDTAEVNEELPDDEAADDDDDDNDNVSLDDQESDVKEASYLSDKSGPCNIKS